jgi:CO/xanthine dehydrogenase FAD-binding subunit
MSLTGITAYLRPETLEEAFAMLGAGVVPLGGGTDLIHRAPPGTTTLVDLDALPLRYIRNGDGFAVGATTTLTEMLEHPGLAAHLDGVVAGMLRRVGSPLLRNAATIGGHLARGRLSDIVPLLLALDATVTVYDGTERSLPLARYYAEGVHRTRCLITEVAVPAAGDDTAASFLKFTRTAYDLALLNCAARVRLGRDGRVAECRLVVGETPALGAAVASAAAALDGGPLDDEHIAAAAEAAAASVAFGSDQRAAADYRRALCRAGLRRCLGEVRRRFEERGR